MRPARARCSSGCARASSCQPCTVPLPCTVSASSSPAPNNRRCPCAGCWKIKARAPDACRPSTSKPWAIGAKRRRGWAALEDFDVIIFTSANAVRFGASLLEQRRDLTLAALGPATARALNQSGYRVAVQPESIDSEGLLLHPRLAHPTGRRILIIKGSNGRPFLEQELAQRGAQVVTRGRLPASAGDSQRGGTGVPARVLSGRGACR